MTNLRGATIAHVTLLSLVLCACAGQSDSVRSLEAGNANQAIADDEVLAFTTSVGRVVVTLNRKHFIRLHHERPTHAGIVVCTFDSNFQQLALRIHEAPQQTEDFAGQLVRVNCP